MDFAWKVRQRMKFTKNPSYISLIDKYLVKEYAASKGVSTAEVYYVTETAETIPFGKLPENCFIKANHGCEWNILRDSFLFYLFGGGAGLVDADGSLITGEDAAGYLITQEECIDICNYWLSLRYSEDEWAYRFIRPKIVVEELLVARVPGELKDYRMYVFGGSVKAINVGSPSYRNDYKNVFFDREWNEIKLTEYREAVPDPLPSMPDCLEELLDCAERLGEGIDFVRVDLFDTSKGVMLGEMTMYPEAGLEGTPTACPVFNLWLGDQWEFAG